MEGEVKKSFETGAITADRYSPTARFDGPFASFDSVQTFLSGYNVVKAVFDAQAQVHGVESLSRKEFTAKWTVTLRSIILPLKPSVTITGQTAFIIDPDTGMILSRRDVWDALPPVTTPATGLLFLAGQLPEALQTTPDLDTPRYQVLKKCLDYEIRQYQPFLVVETSMAQGTGTAAGTGFNELASYIFGGNTEGLKMEMTTPVITTAPEPGADRTTMGFVIESRLGSDPSRLPAPADDRIFRAKQDIGYVAAVRFSGWPLEKEVKDREVALRDALIRDGLRPRRGYQLARYNDPFTPPFLRRNEVIVALDDFIWP